MSWLFSQALVEEYLGGGCLDGEQSVQSNGKPIQQAYCAPDKMTKFSRLFRYGMTFKPLTENLGQELLTLYQADFHVKTSAQPVKEMDLMEKEAECGKKWQGLLAKYDPNTHSLRTAQCSLLEDLNECLQTWPRWGSMRNGECFQQPMLEQITKGTEYGLSEKIPNNLDFFHTPCTTGIDGGSNSRKALKKRMEVWPTPQSNDAKNAVVRHRTKSLQVMLGGEIAMRNSEVIGGHLNPTWVEWLMGWHLGWTDLKPLETDKSHFVQQLHGDC